ncbi:MAG: hypothetical protein HFF04_08275 [Oscillospiraceae bacterium]|nr:hypothetical protein [Oscillospiraceae bacterium]
MDVQAKEVKRVIKQEVSITPHTIQKGPLEGMVMVDGRPQVEQADMLTISFDSIEAIMRLTKEK